MKLLLASFAFAWLGCADLFPTPEPPIVYVEPAECKCACAYSVKPEISVEPVKPPQEPPPLCVNYKNEDVPCPAGAR